MTLQNKTNSPYARVAKISFGIFLFFTFFGTSMPFQPAVHTLTVDEIGTSNKINQVVYGLLLGGACFSLIPKRFVLISLIKKEKFLSLFLFWCLLSISWSEFSYVSFKRWFQIFTIVLTCLTFLLHTDSTPERLKYFKYILYLYLTLTLLSVLLIPGAKDPDFMTWRGLTPTKNILGQVSLISSILCFIALRLETTLKGKFLTFSMLLISLLLMIGTNSSTVILSFLFLIWMGTLLSIDNLFRPLGIGHTFSLAVFLAFSLLIVSTIYLAPDLISSVPVAFGKDMTFSGRIDLWDYIIHEAKNHLFLGTGFQGFWVMENVDLLILYEQFVWFPFQAHNGYLDILNETGLVGLILFSIMTIFYFKNVFKLQHPHPWKWFVIIALTINFQESTLFRPGNVTNVMFVFSYLLLHIELIRQKRDHLFS